MIYKNIKLSSGEFLIVRQAAPKDAAAVIKYLNNVAGETDFHTFGVGEYDKTVAEEKKIIKEHKEFKNKILLVAELNGEIAGILNFDSSNRSRIRHRGEFGMSVRKIYWGKSIGSYLIKIMLDWARGSGVIRKINLVVQTDNDMAVVLYKKFGFETEGIVRRDSFVNGKFYDSYLMGLLID